MSFKNYYLKVILLAVLGIEPRAVCMLSMHYIKGPYPQNGDICNGYVSSQFKILLKFILYHWSFTFFLVCYHNYSSSNISSESIHILWLLL